jgi:hypothetical protein
LGYHELERERESLLLLLGGLQVRGCQPEQIPRLEMGVNKRLKEREKKTQTIQEGKRVFCGHRHV